MQISKHAAARPYTEVMAKTAMPSFGGRPLLSPEGTKALGDAAAKWLPLAAASLPLVAGTVAGASALFDKMTAASRKAQAFKTMVGENPHLHDRDPILVQRYFNTLHNLNPQLAHDPTVAASFVNNMVMTGTNPAMPHRDIYAQALQLQRGGPAPRGGGGLEAAMGVSNALLNVSKVLGNEREEKLLGQLEASKGELGTMKGDFGKMKGDLDQQRRKTEFVRKFVSKQKGQAQAAGRDRDYYESLLQQHGIQY